jgi:hypothetical protein
MRCSRQQEAMWTLYSTTIVIQQGANIKMVQSIALGLNTLYSYKHGKQNAKRMKRSGTW